MNAGALLLLRALAPVILPAAVLVVGFEVGALVAFCTGTDDDNDVDAATAVETAREEVDCVDGTGAVAAVGVAALAVCLARGFLAMDSIPVPSSCLRTLNPAPILTLGEAK